MRLVLVVLLLGAFLVVGWTQATGRARPWLLVAIGILLAYSGSSEVRWLAHEHAYSVTARALTGHTDVRVHCQRTLGAVLDTSHNMGYVPYGPDGSSPGEAFLREDTCVALHDYSTHQDQPSSVEVRAVHVLTHESMHLGGERDESVAECEAIQRDAETARLLGATDIEARALAAAYYTLWYPTVPEAYRNAQCVPDGSLDEHRANAPWAAAG